MTLQMQVYYGGNYDALHTKWGSFTISCFSRSHMHAFWLQVVNTNDQYLLATHSSGKNTFHILFKHYAKLRQDPRR